VSGFATGNTLEIMGCLTSRHSTLDYSLGQAKINVFALKLKR
jgi:hypothetical protein